MWWHLFTSGLLIMAGLFWGYDLGLSKGRSERDTPIRRGDR